MKLLNLLKPKNINEKKIRLGLDHDGGYVLPEIIAKESENLVSYGVGKDIGLEIDYFNRYNKNVYLFDHTDNFFEKLLIDNKNFFYYKEGLGNNNYCKDFLTHRIEKNIPTNSFLKIDVEGAEYDYFDEVNIIDFSENCIGFCLEIHSLENTEIQKRAENILEKIQTKYDLCHIHGNNFANCFYYGPFILIQSIELTFINKKLVKSYSNNREKYPIEGLDYQNLPGRLDYKFDFLNFI